jgi:hypothetical protein
MHLSKPGTGLLLVIGSLGLMTGCSSSSSNPTADGGTSDGPGADAPQSDSPSGTPNIHGVLENLLNMPAPAKNITTSALGQTTTDDANGNWGLTLPLNQPFSQLFTSPGYATLTEQEAILLGDYNRGATLLPDNGTVTMLASFLTTPAYDSTLGVLSVAAVPNKTTCMSEDGGMITVSPAGNSKVVYVRSGIPSSTATTIAKGSFPSAIAYNLPTGVNLTVTFSYPAAGDGGAGDGGTGGCTQMAWPVPGADATSGLPTDMNLKYTGNVQTIGGPTGQGATSFIRLFLQ